MTNGTGQVSLTQAAKAFGDYLGQGLQLGLGLLGAVRLPDQDCGCGIPPPCWAPQPAGSVTSEVCAGGKDTVRVRVTNCGMTPRTITVTSSGDDAEVGIDNGMLTLGSLETAVATASVDIPASVGPGAERNIILWIRGCQEHYVRWTAKVSSKSGACCAEVDVEDCPDLVHHWYDHFYCDRPCPEEHFNRGNG
jgi:hypothetical protein